MCDVKKELGYCCEPSEYEDITFESKELEETFKKLGMDSYEDCNNEAMKSLASIIPKIKHVNEVLKVGLNTYNLLNEPVFSTDTVWSPLSWKCYHRELSAYRRSFSKKAILGISFEQDYVSVSLGNRKRYGIPYVYFDPEYSKKLLESNSVALSSNSIAILNKRLTEISEEVRLEAGRVNELVALKKDLGKDYGLLKSLIAKHGFEDKDALETRDSLKEVLDKRESDIKEIKDRIGLLKQEERAVHVRLKEIEKYIDSLYEAPEEHSINCYRHTLRIGVYSIDQVVDACLELKDQGFIPISIKLPTNDYYKYLESVDNFTLGIEVSQTVEGAISIWSIRKLEGDVC